jgi:WD40 repeat protein/cytochrome c-type biogenesis protein CcmH/NrfG
VLERLNRWRRRNPVVAALTAVTLSLLLVIAVGSGAFSLYLHRALIHSEEADRDKTEQLFESLLSQAQARRFSRQIGQRLDALDALGKAAVIRHDDRLRDEAIAALTLPDLRAGPIWPAWPPGTIALGFDPSYRTYAQADSKNVIHICSRDDEREILRIETGEQTRIWEYGLQFSPDGRFLAVHHYERLVTVWRVRDGRRILRVPAGHFCYSFARDGRQFAVGNQKTARVFDLATGKESNRWDLPAPSWRMAFDPDSKRLAVGYKNQATIVSIFEAATGKVHTELPVGPVDGSFVAWHPDGNRLGIAGTVPYAQIWDVQARRRVAALEGHAQFVSTISFHPDGELVATYSWDGTLRLWDPATGRQLLQLAADVHHPYFSADGRYLGCIRRGEGGKEAQLLEVAVSREYRTLVTREGIKAQPAVYGDIGPHCLFASFVAQDGTHLWDLESGHDLATIAGQFDPLFRQGDTGPEMITSSVAGWFRWPVMPHGSEDGVIGIGPPRRVPSFRNSPGMASLGANGRLLAHGYSDKRGPLEVLDFATGKLLALREPQPGADFLMLSPDGRWAAGHGWNASSVVLWDAQTGERVRQFPVLLPARARACFTPDSRTLIISVGGEYRFHDVATGNVVRCLQQDVYLYPEHIAFSPDGRLMAVPMAPGEIHLREVISARLIARLQDPHGDRSIRLIFTDGGTRLIAVCHYARAIHVWDLRLIRQRLKEMDLDWHWPEFPPAARAKARLRQIRVDLGELWPDSDPAGALARYEELERRKPLDGETHYRRARALARLKRLKEAEAACTNALKQSADHAGAWVLRGECRGQLGLLREAIADYCQAIRLRPRDVALYIARAELYIRLRQYGPSLADHEKALELVDPDNWPRRAASLAWRLTVFPPEYRNLNRARQLAEEALRQDPADSDYRYILGTVYFRLRRLDEARDLCERSLREVPRDAGWHLLSLALIHHAQGKPAKAKQCFERALVWCGQTSLPPHQVPIWEDMVAEARAALGLAPKP